MALVPPTSHGANQVASVFGRTGSVVAVAGDYAGVVASALTGATAATRYVGGTASGAPVAGTFAVGDFVIDQTGKVWVCTVAGTPGTWAQVGGSQPFRIVTVTFAHNTPNILTGIPYFTPVAGEIIGGAGIGQLIPTVVFNGTTPELRVFSQGDNPAVSPIVIEPLNIADPAYGAHTVGVGGANVGSVAPPGASCIRFTDATPVLLAISDGAGGDPGSTQGNSTLYLYLSPPPA